MLFKTIGLHFEQLYRKAGLGKSSVGSTPVFQVKLSHAMVTNISTASSNGLLTFTEFTVLVDRLMSRFLQEVLQVYQQSQGSAYQTEQMNQQMGSLLELANAVQSSATETHLLAVNMLVESAKQGRPAGHFADMATHVQQLAHQSGEFSHEVVDEVDAAQTAIQHIKTLILHVSQRELDRVLAAKRQIDFSLGCLQTLEALLGSSLTEKKDRSLAAITSLAQQAMQQLGTGLSTLRQKAELFSLNNEAQTADDLKRLQQIRLECESLESAELIMLI